MNDPHTNTCSLSLSPSLPLCLSLSQAKKAALGDDPAVEAIDSQIERVKAGEWMCAVFDQVLELSRRLTEWSITSGIQLAQGRRIAGVTRYHGITEPENKAEEETGNQTFLICTGGGPGFMEAANMGAAMVPGSKNIGVILFAFVFLLTSLSVPLYLSPDGHLSAI
jgi:hypothetical protein